ncbi:MAG: hypothetical protein A2X86_09865 [Bdellovibrionales bacterium GWA2_49_15]|nr:MAG: hypothetical protein A2X86_09865 [Bdellovibrionales bacterium GWA2_49_15]HAZ13089.1 hypothetical protein [Bdellovibrionales bacterium]
MSLHYWRSQYCKLPVRLLFIVGCLLAVEAYAEEYPGILESLETILNSHKDQVAKLETEVSKNQKTLGAMKELQEVKIDPILMRSILFYSDWKYLQLTTKNPCNFQGLLTNDLLKSYRGVLQNIAISYRLKSKTNKEQQSALTERDDFVAYSFKNECFSLKQIETLFHEENISNTMKNVHFNAPKNKNDCLQDFQSWMSNPYLPFLCKFPELATLAKNAEAELLNADDTDFAKIKRLKAQVRESANLTDKIPYFQRTFIKNLCSNLDNIESFCSIYLTDNIWSKVINGEEPKFKMTHLCSLALNKAADSKNLGMCQTKFLKDQNFCTQLGVNDYPALSPRPNCLMISEALNMSNLISDYHDCPALVSNEGITNMSRIIMHLENKSSIPSPSFCAFDTSYTFAKMQLEFGNDDAWPLKICYWDKFENAKVCKEYVPGENPDVAISETNVLGTVLYRMYGAPTKTQCRFIEKRKYRPALLEYKNGCFIVYDGTNCSTSTCSKEIIYNQNVVKDIEYVGSPLFEYFPSTFANSKFAASEVLVETYKITQKRIGNFTELKTFFTQKKKNIVHGIGCIEDIYPFFFKKSAMNECRPVPFIIDGVAGEGRAAVLSIRTAIDDVHMPRIIPWNYVFSAVATYAALHPNHLWSLYAIRP